jgi:hypothetical protein
MYYVETRADNSGYTNQVKVFVRVHFSKTIKGIHLKLGILVHSQKRTQLQQGDDPVICICKKTTSNFN